MKTVEITLQIPKVLNGHDFCPASCLFDSAQ
jgi:hypothetical protein